MNHVIFALRRLTVRPESSVWSVRHQEGHLVSLWSTKMDANKSLLFHGDQPDQTGTVCFCGADFCFNSRSQGKSQVERELPTSGSFRTKYYCNRSRWIALEVFYQKHVSIESEKPFGRKWRANGWDSAELTSSSCEFRKLGISCSFFTGISLKSTSFGS